MQTSQSDHAMKHPYMPCALVPKSFVEPPIYSCITQSNAVEWSSMSVSGIFFLTLTLKCFETTCACLCPCSPQNKFPTPTELIDTVRSIVKEQVRKDLGHARKTGFQSNSRLPPGHEVMHTLSQPRMPILYLLTIEAQLCYTFPSVMHAGPDPCY